MESTSKNFGPNTTMVTALRRYGPMTIDYLGYLLGMEGEELERHLATLEEQGVIRREGERILLTSARSHHQ